MSRLLNLSPLVRVENGQGVLSMARDVLGALRMPKRDRNGGGSARARHRNLRLELEELAVSGARDLVDVDEIVVEGIA